MSLLRRIRGIVGNALTWSAAWGVVGAAIYAVAATTWNLPAGAPVGGMILTGALFLAIYGFIAGGAFSLVLLAAERKRTLHQLSPRRVAVWGGLGSLLMAVAPLVSFGFTSDLGVFLLGTGLLGAVSAAGSLSVARRGLLAEPVEVQHIGNPADR